MVWWCWLVVAALAGGRVQVDPDGIELASEPGPALDAARAAMQAGAWEDAARQLHALADASGDPGLSAMAVLARYESGALRAAESEAAKALARHPSHGPLRVLYGLVLADLGRGDEARGALSAARETTDADWTARAWMVEATIDEDEGLPQQADGSLGQAAKAARRGGEPALSSEIAARQASLRSRTQDDRIGQVSEALSSGRLDAARARAEAESGGDRRTAVRQAVARAMVARAEGDLRGARRALEEALRTCADAGLLRERLVAQLELSRVLVLEGEEAGAVAVLERARGEVAGTSLRVREADVRVALAIRLAAQGRLEEARAELRAASDLAARVDAPLLQPGLDEAEARIALASGRLDEASSALARAQEAWATAGRHAETARVALERIRLAARQGKPEAFTSVEAVLARGGLAAPVAERMVAEGLGLADAGDLVAAVARLEEAATRATGDGDDALAARARRWTEEAAARLGIEGDGAALRVARAASGRKAYARGREAFEAARYGEAIQAFAAARADLAEAGEAAPAQQATEAWLLARWNDAVSRKGSAALLEALRDEARALDAVSLAVRAEASAAVARAVAGAPDAARLEAAAMAARAEGLDGLAVRCFAERARVGPPEDAERAAREADELLGGALGATALVDAAFVAWRGDDVERAATLLRAAGDRPTGASEQDAQTLRSALRDAGIDPSAPMD